MHRLLILMLFPILLLPSCEEEFEPSTEQFVEKLVLEGYIESGDVSTPPYVLATRSIPFAKEINANTIAGLFVHEEDLMLTVNNQGIDYPLTEYCYKDIPEEVRPFLNSLLGDIGDIIEISDICIYTNLTLIGEENQSYTLTAEYKGQIYKGVAEIKERITLEGLDYVIKNDTLVELRAELNDPPNEANFYRYQTQRGAEPFYPGLNSVFPDRLFEGGSLSFPLPRGQLRSQEFDIETLGLFDKGDLINVKWNVISETLYSAVITTEFSTGSVGPFSSIVFVDSNLKGTDDNILGMWGGYANSFHSIQTE